MGYPDHVSICNMHHAACKRSMQARHACTHRLDVRDGAAFERDDPIDHANHAAGLHTADATIPAATACISSAVTRPNAHRPDLHRRPAPPRTCASVSDIATVSNNAVPLAMEITPPPPPPALKGCARGHHTTARPTEQCTRAAQRITRPSATGSVHRRCNIQRAPMHRARMQRCDASMAIQGAAMQRTTYDVRPRNRPQNTRCSPPKSHAA